MPAAAHPLTWRDLPLLSRSRKRVLCLDSRRAAIGHGNLLGAGLLALFSAATGIAAAASETPPLLAMASYDPQTALAHWLYLAPQEAVHAETPLAPLAEALIAHPALHGAQALLAEAPLDAAWLPAMRQAGFRICARHHLWLLESALAAAARGAWQWPAPPQRREADRLYANLTPPLARSLLPSPTASPTALVYVEDGRVRGVAQWAAGPRGVWALPMLHPDTHSPADALTALAVFLQRGRLPLYLAIRDNQMWLEGALNALQARPGEIYALLARRIAQPALALSPAEAAAVPGAPQPTAF